MKRTIKKGTVKINGMFYRPRQNPNDLPYDGRLDGTRQYFGIYQNENRYVALGEAPVIDGYVEWSFWERVQP